MNADIQSIEDLTQLVQQGFTDWASLGEVTVKKSKDFLIFNYNDKTDYQNRWNFFECISRGLIIHATTGEIVARSFDKFFNWRTPERCSHAPIVRIMEKLDGSLGILYRQDGQFAIATRGDFNNPQTKWANEYLKRFDLSNLPEAYTLVFELIFPNNRIIVDYADREEFVLLAIRNRFTGDYLAWDQVVTLAKHYGFSVPKSYEFADVDAILENIARLDASAEGYIVEFADGQFFKFKGRRYIEIDRMSVGLSFQAVLNALNQNQLEALKSKMPEEFLSQIDQWVIEIEKTSQDITTQAQIAFDAAPKTSKKEFATWVMQQHPHLSSYLFSLWDGRSLQQMIYLKAF